MVKQNAKQRTRAPKAGPVRPPGRAPRLPPIQIAFLVRLLPYYVAEVRGSSRAAATKFYNKVNREFLLYFQGWTPPHLPGQQEGKLPGGIFLNSAMVRLDYSPSPTTRQMPRL